MDPGIDPIINILFGIIVLFFAVLLLVGLVIKIDAFSHELTHINMEINRTVGRERQYWKRKKRRLWLSLLPFYRR